MPRLLDPKWKIGDGPDGKGVGLSLKASFSQQSLAIRYTEHSANEASALSGIKDHSLLEGG